ncbi:MAG: glycosyltransferase family 9 protein [Actinomycetota bacterium]
MSRVLVARLDSAGDVLLAGPAVRAVAAGRGGGPNDVMMLCGPQGKAAAELLPGVAEVFSWASPWIVDPAPPATKDHVAALADWVRKSRISEAIILTSFHQSPLPLALLLRLAGVGQITGASVDYAGSLLDRRLRPGEDFPEDQPEAERALEIAAAAGYRLPAGDDGRLQVRDIPDTTFLTGDEPYIAVHPGAAVPARAWPPLHYSAAVELLIGAGYRVVVTGGPQERELTATVAVPGALDLGGQTDLRSLAGVLAGASAVVTGNTGPAHLAAAVGTPVVSLFAPVVPAIRWAPYMVPLELLGDQHAPCRLSRARKCPVPGHPCLSNVAPEEVLEAVQRLTRGVTYLSARRKTRNA